MIDFIRRHFGDETANEIQSKIDILEECGTKCDLRLLTFNPTGVALAIIDETILTIFFYSEKEKRITGRFYLTRGELRDVFYKMERLREEGYKCMKSTV